MVAPILLSISCISTAVFAVLYYRSEGERKDLVAKFKTTRDYAEKLTKAISKLEAQNKGHQVRIDYLATQLAATAKPSVNGATKAVAPSDSVDVKKPRKRGPRRKNNNNDNK